MAKFIEPCCIESQLPPLIREHSIVPFQTNGDVTFEKISRAVAPVAGNTITLLLSIPEVDLAMLKHIAWLGRRGWLTEVVFLTATDQSTLIHRELTGDVPTIRCHHHTSIAESLLSYTGEHGTVCVQGHLASTIHPARRYYLATGPQAPKYNAMLLDTIRPLLKRKPDEPTVEEVKGVREVKGVKDDSFAPEHRHSTAK